MNLPNLFISNSDLTPSSRYRDAARVGVWLVFWLAVIDALINVVFAYPANPKNIHPSALQSFFDYGRSIEGKLFRMTRRDQSQTAPITLAGWYVPLKPLEFPAKENARTVTFYGMSHAVRLGEALARVTDRYVPRIVAAPGGPPNWAYGAFLRDRGRGKGQFAILALWSYNLPMVTSIAPMTWASDLPAPYTADRFFLRDDGRLDVVHPPYTSFDEYSHALFNPEEWAAARKTIANYDAVYSSFIMRTNLLDHSSLVRLIRRAYAQRLYRAYRQKVLDASGYHPESVDIKLAQAIVENFAKSARREGITPIIYLVNGYGYSNYLYLAIKPVLDRDNVPFLSSDSIASPNDPRNYLPDSHFTNAVDDRLALALVELIDRLDTR